MGAIERKDDVQSHRYNCTFWLHQPVWNNLGRRSHQGCSHACAASWCFTSVFRFSSRIALVRQGGGIAPSAWDTSPATLAFNIHVPMYIRDVSVFGLVLCMVLLVACFVYVLVCQPVYGVQYCLFASWWKRKGDLHTDCTRYNSAEKSQVIGKKNCCTLGDLSALRRTCLHTAEVANI